MENTKNAVTQKDNERESTDKLVIAVKRHVTRIQVAVREEDKLHVVYQKTIAVTKQIRVEHTKLAEEAKKSGTVMEGMIRVLSKVKSGFSKGVSFIKTGISTAFKQIKTGVSKGIELLVKGTSKAFSGAKALIGGGISITRTIMGAVGPVVDTVGNALGKVLGASGKMEQSVFPLEAQIGDKSKADKFTSELKNYTVSSPFEFEDMAEASKKMLMYGDSTDEVIKKLQLYGDVSAGLGGGAEGINTIAEAMERIKASKGANKGAMDTLTSMGVKVPEYLKDGKELKDGEAFDKITEQMQEDPRFINALVKQSGTLLGLWSSLKKFFNLNILTSFGDGMSEAIKPAFSELMNGLTKSPKSIEAFKTKIKNAGKVVGDAFVKMYNGGKKFFGELMKDNEFKNANFGGKIAIVIRKALEKVKDWLSGEGKGIITGIISTLIDNLTTAIGDSMQTITQVLIPIGMVLGQAIITGVLMAIPNGLANIVEGLDKAIPGHIRAEQGGRSVTLGMPTTGAGLNPKAPAIGSGASVKYEPLRATGGITPSTGSAMQLNGINNSTPDNKMQQTNTTNVTISRLMVREEADVNKVADEITKRMVNYRLTFGGAL